MFDQTMLQAWGIQNIAEASEKTANAMKNATNTMTEAMNKVQTQQAENSKQWMQNYMATAEQLSNCKTPEEFFSKQASSMQSLWQQMMASSQSAATTMTAATTKATDIMTKQMLENMNMYAQSAKSAGAAASKAASAK